MMGESFWDISMNLSSILFASSVVNVGGGVLVDMLVFLTCYFFVFFVDYES